MTLLIGIDPGMSGGIAWYNSQTQTTEVVKMPKTEADIAKVFEELSKYLCHALIEKVHAMPRQGVSSTFKLGTNYGFLRGCLSSSKIPFEDVTPNSWQKYLRCQSGGDKNVTKGKAQQLFPHLKVIHATADALLICEYLRRTYAERA